MFTHRKFSSEISLDYTLKTVFFFPNYYPGQDTPVGYLTFKNESIHTRNSTIPKQDKSSENHTDEHHRKTNEI